MTSASDEQGTAAWDEHVAYLRDTFINQLVRRGMRLQHDKSDGATSDSLLRNDRVTVVVDDGFPFFPPRVRANADEPRTWHQDRDGYLCLYTARDRDTQPWRDVDAFLARIDLWFEHNAAGWPDDHPALDIEVYLNLPVDHRYVLYSDLDRLSDDYIRVRAEPHLLHVIGAGRVPKKSTRGVVSGYVTNVGELERPPHSWVDLIDNVAESQRIKGAIERGRLDLLLVQYTRKGQSGVLAITLRRNRRGQPTPQTALSGSVDSANMQLRAGPTAPTLATKHVYIIGAGALGSHICDGLSRAGIGELTARDADFLSPGNMTRHLVTNPNLCGVHKAQALAIVIRNRPYNRAEVHDNTTSLTSPAEAARLVQDYDLVVDATADGAVTSMLEDAAALTGRRFLTACIQNEGRTLRVDIVPPYADGSPIPATVHREPTQPEVFEAGCGEPVSVAPPHAVTEAAAIAVRHIIGILVGEPETSSGEIREFP